MSSGKSLIYIRKRSGPSRMPCDTPDLTWVQKECSPLTTTLCSRHLRNLEIQACVLLLMPYLFSLFRSRLWGTVSNAFEEPIMIMCTYDLLYRDFDRSRVVSINWEVMLWKSCCVSDKTVLVEMIRYVRVNNVFKDFAAY